MAEVTREWFDEKRRFLEAEKVRLQGALDMLQVMEEELFPPEAEPVEAEPQQEADNV